MMGEEKTACSCGCDEWAAVSEGYCMACLHHSCNSYGARVCQKPLEDMSAHHPDYEQRKREVEQ